MKRLSIALVIFLSTFWITGYAQQNANNKRYTDSLQHLLSVEHTDTGKASILFKLSDYWADIDAGKAIQLANQSLQLDLKKSIYEGLAHFYLGGAYFDRDLLRSQQEYMKADTLLSIYSTKEAWLYRSRAWHNYGIIEQRKDNGKGYTDILLNKAIPLAVKAGDSIRVAIDYMDVGLGFMNYEDHSRAIYYYTTAIRMLMRQGKKDERLADCFVNMAKANILMGNVKAAKPFLDNAFRILSPMVDSPYLPAYYLVNGMYHNRSAEWQKANRSLDVGITLANKLNMPYEINSMLYEKYEVYKGQNNLKAAKAVLMNLYERQHIVPLKRNRQEILHELAQTEASLGNMKAAYQWLTEYNSLADSIYKAKTKTDIAALDAKYQSAEKEKEILILYNRSNIQKILFVCGSVLFLGIIFFLVYRLKQRKVKTEQQLSSLQQKQQIEIANALLEGEERERSRLARDLHDGLGGMLAGVKLNLSQATHHPALRTEDAGLNKVIIQLDDSVSELRRIARNMMPESLMRSGLQVALNDLCESFSGGTVKVELQMLNILSTIPQQTQITIYRIVQELLNNALRHARASEIFVQCSQTEDQFFITVEDDGVGFDKTELQNKKGIGLRNIQNRVDFLRGKLDIDSKPGKGATINIEINAG